MEENTAAKTVQFDDLMSYIENLTFKKAVVGGVEKESAYQALRTMYSMFVDIYVAERDSKEQLQKQLDEISQNRSATENKASMMAKKAQDFVGDLKTQNDELTEQLEIEKQEKTELISKMEKVGAENERLRKELAAKGQALSAKEEELKEKNTEIAEIADRLAVKNNELAAKEDELAVKNNELAGLSREAERLREAAADTHTDREDEIQRLTELAETRGIMVSDLEKKTEVLFRERDELRQQLEAAKSECEENAFQRESLEEIYLDANRRRKEIIGQANQTAEELVAQAQRNAEEIDRTAHENVVALNAEAEQKTQELEQLKAEMDRLLDETTRSTEEMRADALRKTDEDCSAVKAKAEQELEQLRIEAEQEVEKLHTEAEQRSKEIVDNALETAKSLQDEGATVLSAAKREAEELIAEAQKKCEDEAEKLADLRRSVSEYRSQTVQSIENDIKAMQKLASALSLASGSEEG